MEQKSKEINSTQLITEFILVAREYCFQIENIKELSLRDLLNILLKLLSINYLRASLLPNFEQAETYVEKFVQEEDWLFIKENLSQKLGKFESFFDLFTPDTNETENYENMSISECLTDIYQDLKDIVSLSEIAAQNILEAGIAETKISFENYWGPRILSAMSIMHNIRFGSESLDEENNQIGKQVEKQINTDNWIINQRFNDFRK